MIYHKWFSRPVDIPINSVSIVAYNANHCNYAAIRSCTQIIYIYKNNTSNTTHCTLHTYIHTYVHGTIVTYSVIICPVWLKTLGMVNIQILAKWWNIIIVTTLSWYGTIVTFVKQSWFYIKDAQYGRLFRCVLLLRSVHGMIRCGCLCSLSLSAPGRRVTRGDAKWWPICINM